MGKELFNFKGNKKKNKNRAMRLMDDALTRLWVWAHTHPPTYLCEFKNEMETGSGVGMRMDSRAVTGKA